MLYLSCTNITLMSTIKAVIRNKKKQDGTYPLAIRITQDRKSSYVYLGHSIPKDDWDSIAQKVKRSHIHHKRLNNIIAQRLLEIESEALELERTKKKVSLTEIRKKVSPKISGNGFFHTAETFLSDLKKSGKYNRYSAESPAISHFRKFVGKEIPFTDVTVALLNRFKVHLKESRGISQRTIINYLIVIRSVFSLAIKEGVVEKKYYPFGRDKIRIKFPETNKIGLTETEVQAFRAVTLESGSKEQHARNLWLFSFYLAGMRISDVLRLTWNDIQDGRLYYQMNKNSKPVSLQIPTQALGIIEYYSNRKNKHLFVFPDLDDVQDEKREFLIQRKIKLALRHTNPLLQEIASMAGISKKVTFHIARHSFATIAGDKIPMPMLQKLYRHSSIETTVMYQRAFLFKDTDEALNEVIRF